MKRITAILFLAGLLALPFVATAQNATKKDNAKRAHEGWKLVWADEFNGKKLDTDSW